MITFCDTFPHIASEEMGASYMARLDRSQIGRRIPSLKAAHHEKQAP